MAEGTEPADGLIRLALSRDEALVLYHWLGERFSGGEIAPLAHGVVGEVCADLWGQLFGMAPLDDGAFEAQLRHAVERMRSQD